MDSKIVSATSDIKKTVNDYFSKQILKANINNVNGSCPTSLEPMINKCIVPCCQTIFELINIIKWLTFNKTCPVCRTVIDESKLIKIKNNSTTSQSKSERGRTSPVSDITPLESSTSSTQREIIRETAARIVRNKIPTKLEKYVYMCNRMTVHGQFRTIAIYSSFKELLMAIIEYIDEEHHFGAYMVEKYYQLTKEYDESVMLDVHLIENCKDYNWKKCEKYFSDGFCLEIDEDTSIEVNKIKIDDHLLCGPTFEATGDYYTQTFDVDKFSSIIFTFGTFPIKVKTNLLDNEDSAASSKLVQIEVNQDVDGKLITSDGLIVEQGPTTGAVFAIGKREKIGDPTSDRPMNDDEKKLSTSRGFRLKVNPLVEKSLSDIGIPSFKVSPPYDPNESDDSDDDTPVLTGSIVNFQFPQIKVDISESHKFIRSLQELIF